MLRNEKALSHFNMQVAFGYFSLEVTVMWYLILEKLVLIMCSII